MLMVSLACDVSKAGQSNRAVAGSIGQKPESSTRQGPMLTWLKPLANNPAPPSSATTRTPNALLKRKGQETNSKQLLSCAAETRTSQ